MREAVMGSPQAARIKTDVRMPPELVQAVDRVCEALGVAKNAFFALAAGQLAVQLAPLVADRKPRAAVIAAVEEMFAAILARVKDQ